MEAYVWRYAQRNRARPDAYASFLIRFSRRDGDAVCGKCWSAYSEMPAVFHSLEDLLQKMEDEMDSLNCPRRTFSRCPARTERARYQEIVQVCPCAVTVNVLRRQNGGMQGTFQICGTDQQLSFRGTDELVLFFQAALGSRALGRKTR